MCELTDSDVAPQYGQGSIATYGGFTLKSATPPIGSLIATSCPLSSSQTMQPSGSQRRTKCFLSFAMITLSLLERIAIIIISLVSLCRLDCFFHDLLRGFLGSLAMTLHSFLRLLSFGQFHALLRMLQDILCNMSAPNCKVFGLTRPSFRMIFEPLRNSFECKGRLFLRETTKDDDHLVSFPLHLV